MNQIVRDFTGVPRAWPAYSADKVEVMARHCGAIPQTAYYHNFDPVNEMLIFTEPLAAEYFQKVDSKIDRAYRILRGLFK